MRWVCTTHARGLATAASSGGVAEQMLTYVWASPPNSPSSDDAAVDVLRSGLALQADSHAGYDAAR